jgi:hypothetical protein
MAMTHLFKTLQGAPIGYQMKTIIPSTAKDCRHDWTLALFPPWTVVTLACSGSFGLLNTQLTLLSRITPLPAPLGDTVVIQYRRASRDLWPAVQRKACLLSWSLAQLWWSICLDGLLMSLLPSRTAGPHQFLFTSILSATTRARYVAGAQLFA